MSHEGFDKIKEMYQGSFAQYGDSPASLLTPKGRQELRFRALDTFFLSGSKLRILDYGCGLGYLYDYLKSKGYNFDYVGVDIVPGFIEHCSSKLKCENARFELITPDSLLSQDYDLVFSSGVFNIKSHEDDVLSKAYALARVKQLFSAAKGALVVDFLSPYVDFQQQDAQHFSIDEICTFVALNLSRRFMVRHDLLPYEYTLIAHVDSEIQRPENIFRVDNEARGI